MTPSNFDIEAFQVITPAFVYDEASIINALTKLRAIACTSGCKVLFSLKAFAMIDALKLMVPMLEGFASSSLFEAKLARKLLSDTGTVHVTTPGLVPHEVDELAELCDYISFNSLSQWERFSGRASDRVRCGLRVNPQLSFVSDARCNPCRSNSKLGTPLSTLVNTLRDGRARFHGLRGLHFHTNCESFSIIPLLATVKRLELHLGKLLRKLEWINLGGGYQYNEISEMEPFYYTVDLLKRQYGLDVFIEPGEAIVGRAGYIVSSVVDLFESEGKSLAILDTSVNHMPTVSDYRCPPTVLNSISFGPHAYLLAGASCLAGDLFGEYRFHAPLEIGSRVIFDFVGAYTLVKANTFNGINLPNVYAISDQKNVVLKKRYTIEDFMSKWESR